MYELTGDRFEFTNIVSSADPKIVSALKTDLSRLETCKGDSCNIFGTKTFKGNRHRGL